ncbi:MAG: high light inducible protein [Cyanobium sp.]
MDPYTDRDSSSDPSTVESGSGSGNTSGPEPVSQEELNAWRRGLTPQAEIWNGRLAMLGLSMGLIVLILSRLVSHHG